MVVPAGVKITHDPGDTMYTDSKGRAVFSQPVDELRDLTTLDDSYFGPKWVRLDFTQAGKGGLILWPLFGATNQLLAGLAFLVLVFFLLRRNLPLWFAALPMVLMLIMPGWAMLSQIQNDFWPNRSWLLFAFGSAILTLQVWMVVEAILMWPRARGVLEEVARR